MRYVLFEFSILIAPFMPFIAEDIYQKVKDEKDAESVHLRAWPVCEKYDANLLNDMDMARKIVEVGLALRAKDGKKVRQPLSGIEYDSKNKLSAELEMVIADELNVKSVTFVSGLKDQKPDCMTANNVTVFLDTILTPELIEEGKLRELMRAIQEVRKEMNFNPQDKAVMEFSADIETVAFIERYSEELVKKVNLVSAPMLDEDTQGKEIVVEDLRLKLKLEKA